jgi:hypothetical protein
MDEVTRSTQRVQSKALEKFYIFTYDGSKKGANIAYEIVRFWFQNALKGVTISRRYAAEGMRGAAPHPGRALI